MIDNARIKVKKAHNFFSSKKYSNIHNQINNKFLHIYRTALCDCALPPYYWLKSWWKGVPNCVKTHKKESEKHIYCKKILWFYVLVSMYCLFYAGSAVMPRAILAVMVNYLNKLKRSNAAHISVYVAWTHLQVGKKVAAIVRSQHRGAASHQWVGPCTNLNK